MIRSNSERKNELDDNYSWLLLDSDLPRVQSRESCCSYITDPNCRPYRYVIAILLSYILGVLSFCYDIPGGIQSTMIKVMKIDSVQYNLISTGYSWPNIIMSLIGTFIVDQFFNIHVGFVFFGTIVFLGQLIVSLGAYMNSFLVMLIGRIVFGSGIGTTGSILATFQVLWFRNKEITFVASLGRCMCRLMASIALFTPQVIYDALDFIASPYYRHGTTQMAGTLLCLFAVGSTVAISLLDKRGAKIIGRRSNIKKKISICDIKDFSLAYWIAVLTITIFYTVSFSFTSNAPLYFVSKYGFPKVTANLANSLSYISVAFLGPFVAVLIDMYGYNLVWGLFGIVLFILSDLLNIVGSEEDIYVPFSAAVICSVAYTFVGTALWITPGLLVHNHQVTTAFGVLLSLMALCKSVVGIIVGIIIDYYGYMIMQLFYLWLLVIIGLLNVSLIVMESLSAESKLMSVKKNKERK